MRGTHFPDSERHNRGRRSWNVSRTVHDSNIYYILMIYLSLGLIFESKEVKSLLS